MKTKVLLKLTSCRSHVNSLNRHIKNEECVKIWFEQLCNLLAKLLYDIANYMVKEKEKFNKAQKDKILLYLSQLTSSLGLLIQIFIRESTVSISITEARNCVKKQLFWCLEGLEEVLNNDKDYVDNTGSFMRWMDAALDELTEIDLSRPLIENVNIYKKARSITEEVLCHGMSIAQVASSEDCKIIKGSSQSVLESFDGLNKELQKPILNKPMCSLFVDCCNEKLCALEKRVNEAVLKLCLKLFAKYVEPLNRLHDYCLNNDDEERLDMLIVDFDTHVDQIMQVGLFAIACTTNNSVRMKSFLASLEALEVEMVPAFNSLLRDSTEHNKNLSFLLKNYWLHQANGLKNLIYLIIDPYAFARITYEEIEATVNTVIDTMKKNNHIIDNDRVNDVINMGLILDEMLIASIDDIPALNTPDIKKKLHDYNDVLYEVKAASNILIKTKSNYARENSLRIIKRLKILLSVHKKLLHYLADDYQDYKENEESINTKTDNGNEFCIRDSPVLDQLIVRGKQLIKDRSILHKTLTCDNNLKGSNVDDNNSNGGPRKSHIKPNANNNDNDRPIPLLKLVHLRNMSYFNNTLLLRKERNDITAIDLQVTDILEELTSLGDSFK